jgi:hypothetical protein
MIRASDSGEVITYLTVARVHPASSQDQRRTQPTLSAAASVEERAPAPEEAMDLETGHHPWSSWSSMWQWTM